ncbi:MAG TPA: PhoU domain-containing protein [Ktedonobacteraceae bacterium]|jgi:phosphate transport system protein|nr:PhoU domain-containing protein [Ktedonobacteraceae bacterium]
MGRGIPYHLLQRLDQLLQQLSWAVENALSQSISIIEHNNQGLAYKVIASSYCVVTSQADINAYTLHLLAVERSWSERDIRTIVVARMIAEQLMHIGECATSIARSTLHMPFTFQDGERFRPCALNLQRTVSEQSMVRNLLALGHEVHLFLQKTVRVVIEDNYALAAYLRHEDDVVNARYRMVSNDLVTALTPPCAFEALKDDAHFLERAIYLLNIAHVLERIADHCKHINERVIMLHNHQYVVVTELR